MAPSATSPDDSRDDALPSSPPSSRLELEHERGQRLAAGRDRPPQGEPGAGAVLAHRVTGSKDLKALRSAADALAAAGAQRPARPAVRGFA